MRQCYRGHSYGFTVMETKLPAVCPRHYRRLGLRLLRCSYGYMETRLNVQIAVTVLSAATRCDSAVSFHRFHSTVSCHRCHTNAHIAVTAMSAANR